MLNRVAHIGTFFLILSCNSIWADWKPVVLNGIKWTAANQDIQTLEYMTSQGILRIPVKYYGGVDTNVDGKIEEEDILQFTKWVDQHVPKNYDGPIVMDYEKPWWEELRSATITSERLKKLMEPYVKGLKIARKLRPNAKWGYYGIPTRRNTSPKWLEQGHSLEPIFANSKALFPAIYDCSRGKDRNKEVAMQITKSLEHAAGRMPVYAFVTPRYCGESGDRSLFVPDDIFLKRANTALKCSWTDKNGKQHRIKGLVLWDAFGYTPEEKWGELDATHKHYFELLQALVTAWSESMLGIDIVVDPDDYAENQQGLPEPINSGINLDTTKDSETNNNRTEDNRVPNDRIPNNGVPR
ncbi:MAG: hypothetical protein VX436_02320 [Planctomycetota bacterium]|nr:hypothetical protein [Planctomycetota bacterium]